MNNSMIKPFHLSFVTPDLNQSKEFYIDFLECKLGRDTGNWIDILFFGHQLTIHQETSNMPAKAIDHFGPILEKDAWDSIAQKVNASNYAFVSPPNICNNGEANESGKFLLHDTAGNLLEFKYYKNFTTTMKNQ